jgi:hypothetical protein
MKTLTLLALLLTGCATESPREKHEAQCERMRAQFSADLVLGHGDLMNEIHIISRECGTTS